MNVETTIKKIINSIFDSFEKGDITTLESHMHRDVSVWDVFTPELITGENNLHDFHHKDQNQKIKRGKLIIDIEEPLISVQKDSSLALYYLNFSYQEPNALSGRVRVTDVFIQENNVWKIFHHHEGIVPEKMHNLE